MKKLKPTDIRALAKYLARKYRADVVYKKNDARMKLVRAFLKLCQIPAADRFMEDYATTLVPPLLVVKPTVFLPFRPGRARKGEVDNLVLQATVIGHEFHHVRQWRKDKARFAVDYATDKAERARKESEALEVNMELWRYFTGNTLHPGTLAAGLATYGLRKRDIQVVSTHLRSKAITVSRGGVTKKISKQVIAWHKRRR